ncbi:hypothetical protein ACFYO0_46295 [Streptomyces sp. NPDC006365]
MAACVPGAEACWPARYAKARDGGDGLLGGALVKPGEERQVSHPIE